MVEVRRGSSRASRALLREVGLCLLLLVLGLAGPAQAAPERIFVADGHRYVPGDGPDDAAKAETGLALCGIRCNALSGYYDSYLKSPGWRMMKVEVGQERTVELKNPFLGGHCVCTGDVYEVELYYYRPGEPPGAGGAAGNAGQVETGQAVR